MNVLETAKQAEGYILDRRRYYHQHPELSGQEKNTSEQLVRDLEAGHQVRRFLLEMIWYILQRHRL